MNVSCIIPAAGFGKRMESEIPKQFLQLRGKYILERTLEKISEFHFVTEIIMVVNEKIRSRTTELVNAKNFDKVKKIVIGGDSRAESVLNGLNSVTSGYKWVLIHDGARPLVSEKILSDCVNTVKKDSSIDAVIPGLPVKNTVKRMKSNGMIVEKTLSRKKLRGVQTPQIVKKEKFKEAYEAVPEDKLGEYTDDSRLLEEIGAKIRVIEGDKKNLKLTTPFDLKLAEFFITNSRI